MSQENVEIVRRYYAAYAQDGFEPWIMYWSDEIDHRPAKDGIDDPGPVLGKDAMRKHIRDWIDTFDDFWFEAVELIDAGEDTVVAVERFGGRAKLSGVETTQTSGVVLTIRDGKIVRCREHASRAEALEAAGLSEEAKSHANLGIVRQFLEVRTAFLRGEAAREVFEELFDPQIEVRWHDQQTYPDAPQQFRGGPAVVAFSEQYRDGWLDVAAELLELSEAPGGRVIALSRQSARGRQSGVPIVIHFFEVFTIRNGKIRKDEFFRHRTDALEAVGLSE